MRCVFWKKAIKIAAVFPWPPTAGDPPQTPCLFFLLYCYNFL